MKSLYEIKGIVKTGAKRGKNLGFPTANIEIDEKIPEGIYAAKVAVDGNEYNAAAFIGAAETFGEKEFKAEAYILGFSGDIYGKQITIKLFKKLRENKRFDNKNQLVEQMKKDVLATREFFGE